MICNKCHSQDIILERVSFFKKKSYFRFFSTGIYGIEAKACMNCGNIYDFSLPVDALRKNNAQYRGGKIKGNTQPLPNEDEKEKAGGEKIADNIQTPPREGEKENDPDSPPPSQAESGGAE